MTFTPKPKIFRAWCPHEEKMIFSGFSILGDVTMFSVLQIHQCEAKERTKLENDLDLIITEYTGVNDKNGKQIFEGDIIRHQWRERNVLKSEYYLVQFCPELGTFAAFRKDTRCSIRIGWCEVVGNIFENPELLEK